MNVIFVFLSSLSRLSKDKLNENVQAKLLNKSIPAIALPMNKRKSLFRSKVEMTSLFDIDFNFQNARPSTPDGFYLEASFVCLHATIQEL